MPMELAVFRAPGKEWDEFASRYTDLTFYQSLWSEVLKEGLGGTPLYFYLKKGGEIVAGLPAVLLNFRVLKILYASIPYGHFIGEKAYFPVLLELVEEELRRRGIDQVRIVESPFSEPYRIDAFEPIGAKCTLVDLQGMDEEKIWSAYKRYIRRDVRKAEKSGVTIRIGTSREDVQTFHALYLASMERNKALAKYPFRWFEAIHKVIVEKGVGTFLLASLNQATIAGVVLIHSPAVTHYFHNGSRHEFLKYCPNELLIHFSLKEAIGRGDSCFDFMGSDPQDLSLIHFKEKWGGHSLNIHTYVKSYHPLKAKVWEWGKGVINTKIGSMLYKRLSLIRPPRLDEENHQS
jgi:hypothetical protein